MKKSFKTNPILLLPAYIICFLFSVALILPAAAQITITGSNAKDGSYTSLTKASGAFFALNSITQTGKNITISITGDVTTEDGANALTGAAGMWTSLTISPSGARTISGTVAKPIIDFNGADNVTINGLNTGGNSLTISNASTSTLSGTSTIRFINDAKTNTIKNCNIYGSAGSGMSPNYAAVILFNTATVTTGTGNDDNIIEYNNITNAGTRPIYVLFSVGGASAGQENSNNIVRYNNVYDFFNPATGSNGIFISIYNIGWTIQGNSFYETTASPGFVTSVNNIGYTVISIMAGNGYTISGNYIGGNAANCSGTWYKKGDFDNSFTGIYVKAVAGTTNSIQGNIIKGFNWSNTNASNTTATTFTAILASGTPASNYADFNIGDVTGNIIGAATGNGSIIFTANYMGGTTGTTSTFYGINVTYGGVVVIKNNTIGAITAANSTAANGTHIYAISRDFHGTAATNIENNTIGSTDAGTNNSLYASSPATGATSAQIVYAIRNDETGPVVISGNTISKLTNGSTTASTSVTTPAYAIGIITTSGTNSIINNSISNLTCGSATVDANYQNSVVGIAHQSTTATAQTISGNTIYNLSNTNASFTGSVIGLWYNGPTTASEVSKNFIYGLSASSTAGGVYAIKINAGATIYSNNIISIGGTAVAPLYGTFYGIYENGSASNNNSLFFNTVYIGGTPTSGTAVNSYALYSAVNTNTRDFRNNIFNNARSNSGTATGSHYAAYIVTSGGTLTCNYNDYYASGAGGVLGYYAANKTVLPIVTAQDVNSLAINPLFTGAGGTLSSDYFLSATLPGVTGTGITTDYSGNVRSGSQPRLGAWELNHILAVTIISFCGSASENANLLQWATANEIDNNYFELQRSINGYDFGTIATINGSGSTTNTHWYNYKDERPLDGNDFYRLKQVDKNGRFIYSAIVTIARQKRSEYFAIYPNPAVNTVVINIQISGTGVVRMFNGAGVLVLSKVVNAGLQQLDISKLPKGMYYVNAGTKTMAILIE